MFQQLAYQSIKTSQKTILSTTYDLCSGNNTEKITRLHKAVSIGVISSVAYICLPFVPVREASPLKVAEISFVNDLDAYLQVRPHGDDRWLVVNRYDEDGHHLAG